MAFMKSRWWVGAIGLLLLGGGCANERVSQTPSQTGEQSVTVSQVAPPAPLPSAATLPNVTVSAAPNRPLSVPNLVPPTSATQRVPEIATGRADPFAAVASIPTVTVNPATTNPVPTNLVPTNPVVSGTPSAQPSLPVATAPRQAPADRVQVTPPAPVTIASQIIVSGIIQAGDRVSAIVQVPTEATTRYVNAGDYLANGRVLVKRIDVAANTEPVVVLEQDGVETTRTVGSGNVAGVL
jgi:hypothetical protein